MSGIIFLPHLGASVALQSGVVGGNTSGASTFFGSNVVWAGGSNVTLQVSSDTVYIHGASGGTATGGGGAMSLVGSQNVTVVQAGSIATIQGPDLAGYADVTHTHAQYVASNRNAVWSSLGVVFSSTNPGAGVVYSDWVAGSSGYFMWINIP